MQVRSLSRTMKSAVAAGVLALAVPGAALAVPAPPDSGTPAATVSGNTTAGTDVAAPDQQNPIPAEPKPVPQQAPTWPENPQVLTPTSSTAASADGGFEWDDAGIGAGGALVVVLAGLGGVMALRRRHVADPPLAA
jgi:hypothetical protein